jgi:predicted RNA-binding Zn-ribbon protein involved in translation (DUF1610 family)
MNAYTPGVAMVVEFVCGGCGTTINVLPLETSSLLGEVVPVDLKPEIHSRLANIVDERGGHFAVADSAGRFACPECGDSGVVPMPP